MQKNKDLLVKDVNFINSLNEIFREISCSKKIRSVIDKNKKTTQYNVLSNSAIENKMEESENKSVEKQPSKISSEFITLTKNPEIINCTCFDQGNIESISKFYTIYSEKDYIKDELILNLKKVISKLNKFF